MSSTKSTSFWSSIPGFITGLAGVVTGIVGLITVLIQLDVIGGGSDDNASPTSTQPGGAATQSTSRSGASGGSGGAGQSGAAASFSVEPQALTFDLLNKERSVTVRNTGSAALTLESPDLDGAGAGEFTVNAENCTGESVDPGTDCAIKVSYSPETRGNHQATLRITAAEGSTARQVSLTGSRPL